MNKLSLFQIRFKVRPAVGHPLYYEIQYGLLVVFCFGLTELDAAKLAFEIVKMLPYEIIEETPTGALSNQSTEDSDFKKSGADEARQIGVAFRLLCVETGMGDESEIVK